MTKQINKYLFNLVSADLKELQRVLPHYIDFSQKEKQNPDYWQKKVNATNNKIAPIHTNLFKYGFFFCITLSTIMWKQVIELSF